VAWFLGQSLPFIFLAFVLGVLVGWLWWGRRRVRAAEPAQASENTVVIPTTAGGNGAPAEVDAEPTVVVERVAAAEPVTDPELVTAGQPAGTFLESPVEAGIYVHLAAEPASAEEPTSVISYHPAPPQAQPVESAPVEAEPETAEPETAEPEPDAVEPEPAAEPEADDLQRIEGIGPKMSSALHAAGIRTYAQLAGTDVDRLRSAIEAAGLRFAPSLVTWARQARLLADGDEAGFEELTRRLVAGRDVGRA
jgi:predicted flap endonuclease-1-like 5' DNA nuclease